MYTDIENQQHFSLQDLREKHKNISFPITGPDDSWLSENGYEYFEELPDLTAHLTNYRYTRECEGVVYNGLRYHTDRESRATWLTLYLAAGQNPTFVLPAYKAMDGWGVNLTAADIAAIFTAGQAHVTICFAVESALQTQLSTMNSTAQVEEAFDAAYTANGGQNG